MKRCVLLLRSHCDRWLLRDLSARVLYCSRFLAFSTAVYLFLTRAGRRIEKQRSSSLVFIIIKNISSFLKLLAKLRNCLRLKSILQKYRVSCTTLYFCKTKNAQIIVCYKESINKKNYNNTLWLINYVCIRYTCATYIECCEQLSRQVT